MHALRDVNPRAAALLEEAPKQAGGSGSKGHGRSATGRAMRSGSSVRPSSLSGLLAPRCRLLRKLFGQLLLWV